MRLSLQGSTFETAFKQSFIRTHFADKQTMIGQRLPALLYFTVLWVVLSWGTVPTDSTSQTPHASSRSVTAQKNDSASVAQVVDQFNAALAAGDSASVARLLAPDATILEGGRRESRTQYLGHHFHSDHAFLSALARETRTRRIRVEGRVAWVTSTGRLYGTYDGQSYDLNTAGLLVLHKTGKEWCIQAVHWSSGSGE